MICTFFTKVTFHNANPGISGENRYNASAGPNPTLFSRSPVNRYSGSFARVCTICTTRFSVWDGNSILWLPYVLHASRCTVRIDSFCCVLPAHLFTDINSLLGHVYCVGCQDSPFETENLYWGVCILSTSINPSKRCLRRGGTLCGREDVSIL